MVTTSSSTRILVVEDDAIVARDIEESLQTLGYQVVGVAANAESAVARAEEHRPDLVLMDIRLPGPSDGIDAGTSIGRSLDIPIVYLTAHADPHTLERAKASGSWGYIVKPFDGSGLRAAVEVALERHRDQGRLRSRETRFRRLYRGDTWASFSLDEDGSVAECSEAFASLLGVGSSEGMLGRRLREFLPVPSEYDHLASLARSAGWVLPHERTLRRVDGAMVCVVMSLRADGGDGRSMLGRLVDITEQKRTESGLDALRHEETVRRVAKGVAAIFSGPLTTILARAELVTMEEGISHSAREDAEEILTSASELAAVTHRLLAVAEETLTVPRTFSLGGAVRDLLPAIAEELGTDVRVTLELTEKPDGVRIDPLLLGRALLALASNAGEAMKGLGELTLRVGLETIRAENAMPLAGVEAGRYVRLSVEDDGPGMDDARMRACVEPFFTTKPHRAGLGLSAARGIVSQAGGWLGVGPAVGGGTRVSLYLPWVRMG